MDAIWVSLGVTDVGSRPSTIISSNGVLEADKSYGMLNVHTPVLSVVRVTFYTSRACIIAGWWVWDRDWGATGKVYNSWNRFR